MTKYMKETNKVQSDAMKNFNPDDLMDAMEEQARPILATFGIEHRNQILYSPTQQGTLEEIQAANSLAENFD